MMNKLELFIEPERKKRKDKRKKEMVIRPISPIYILFV